MNYYEHVAIFQSLLKGLDDEELTRMNSAVSMEIDARIKAKLDRGDFVSPTPEQLLMFQNGSKLAAIQEYRHQKNVGLMFAKRLFEKLT